MYRSAQKTGTEHPIARNILSLITLDNVTASSLRPSVYVTRQLFPSAHALLEEHCDVEIGELQRPPTQQEIMRKIRGRDGLLCLITDTIDKRVLAVEPRLAVVSSMSVGYNHVDVEEATRRGIYVTYTPGVLTEATADFTWALLMSVARRVVEGDRYVRKRKWKLAWSPTMLLGDDVHGKTLGIIGLGRIGMAVAKRARGFNMRILYHDSRRVSTEQEQELSATHTSLERLLRESDYVTIHVPATKDTQHMIDQARLKTMKPTSFLVNTSRGTIVDEKALVKALRMKWIAGAAIDVWEQEPSDPDNPLSRIENFVGTPHIASATIDARTRMAELAANNLISVLKGEMPPHLVNEEVLGVRPLSSVKLI